jgi:hypothetical protein
MSVEESGERGVMMGNFERNEGLDDRSNTGWVGCRWRRKTRRRKPNIVLPSMRGQ